jgi:phosphonate transport system substrate-binding protein
MGVRKVASVIAFLISLAFTLISLPVAEGRVLVFGRVHDDPVRQIRDRQEFVDYIANKLQAEGVTAGKILVVDKMHLLAQAIKEGKVDMFHDSVVPTLVLGKASGAVPILRQWKYGEAEYHSVILVRKDSGIDSLAQLKGKLIAFDEPHSTSAAVLPRMVLAENKIKLVQLLTPGAAVSDAINFVYGNDGSAINLLISGRVDAAAAANGEFEELRPEIRNTLKVIGKSMSVPRQLIAVRKDLDGKLVKALREVLLNMDKDPEGQQVLKRQQKTAKIDEIPEISRDRIKSIEKFVFSSLSDQVKSW